jgi:pyridoxamine 5'-phosphate oxidase
VWLTALVNPIDARLIRLAVHFSLGLRARHRAAAAPRDGASQRVRAIRGSIMTTSPSTSLLSPHDPIARFQEAFARALATEAFDASAASLATADASGAPSSRMVLLRGVGPEGFVFHTNRSSRKGHDLAENPRAALCFWWPRLGEQVRVEGCVELLADAASDAYFASRPRGHQVGAWASLQSQELGSRAELEARMRESEERFAGRDVPRPPHWGGYLLVPTRVELWKDRQDRLHERVVFERREGQWDVKALYP